MILFICLILMGCFLEIKTASDNPLPIERILPDIDNALDEINVIPLLANVEDEQMQIFDQRFEQVHAFGVQVINSLDQLRNSERFTVEDRLITNLIYNEISSFIDNIEDQEENVQLTFEQSMEYLEIISDWYEILDTYVQNMQRQYAEPEPQEYVTIVQIMESNGILRDLSYRTAREILERRRMELNQLVSRTQAIFNEFPEIEERDVEEIQITRELYDDIGEYLFYARIPIQTGGLSIEERLAIIRMIEYRYQALHSHIQNMYMMYQKRIIDRRRNEVSELIKRVWNIYDQLYHMQERNESEILETDQLVKEINLVMPFLINTAGDSDLPYNLRLENLDIIEENFQRLDCYVREALNTYGQSTQDEDSEGESSWQECPQPGPSGYRKRKDSSSSSSDGKYKKFRKE